MTERPTLQVHGVVCPYCAEKLNIACVPSDAEIVQLMEWYEKEHPPKKEEATAGG